MDVGVILAFVLLALVIVFGVTCIAGLGHKWKRGE